MISKDQIVSSSFVRYGVLPLGLIALVVVLRIFFFTPFRVMTTAQAPLYALEHGHWLVARRAPIEAHSSSFIRRDRAPLPQRRV